MNKKLTVLSLILLLSLTLSGFRGSGRVNDDKEKQLEEQTTLQSNVSVEVDGRAYWFAKGVDCRVISSWDDPNFGPRELIEVSGIRWEALASVCD